MEGFFFSFSSLVGWYDAQLLRPDNKSHGENVKSMQITYMPFCLVSTHKHLRLRWCCCDFLVLLSCVCGSGKNGSAAYYHYYRHLFLNLWDIIFYYSTSAPALLYCSTFRYTAAVGGFCRFVDDLRMHKKCRETEVKKGWVWIKLVDRNFVCKYIM